MQMSNNTNKYNQLHQITHHIFNTETLFLKYFNYQYTIRTFAFNSDMFSFQYNADRYWRGEIIVILQYHGIGNLRFFQVTSLVFLGTVLEKWRMSEVSGIYITVKTNNIQQNYSVIFHNFTVNATNQTNQYKEKEILKYCNYKGQSAMARFHG